MKPFILCLILIQMSLASKSQTAEDSVKAVVNQLFAAMKESDAEKLKACFSDSALLQTIGRNKEGMLTVRNESIEAFVQSVQKAPKGALDERISFDMIKIDGQLASVWTPYSFYYNGQFSHCGVNSFQLINAGNGWKIHFLIDTRRRTGCQ